MKQWNHIWAKLILKLCSAWDCGQLRVFDLPSGSTPGKKKDELADPASGLLGRPWAWSSFKDILKYKAKDAAIKVEYVKSEKTEAVEAVLAVG